MTYAYYRTGTAAYKTDATNEFNYMVATLTNASGLLVWPTDTTLIYRDYHFRNIFQVALAARLMRSAGQTATATTWINQCDVWAKAAFDTLGGGTPTSSITRHGWDADNASGQTGNVAWSAGATIAAGTIRKPTVNNARLYRARNAGTTHASTQPTWPTTVGSTVTDNGITWVCTSNTGSIFAPTYTNNGTTYPAASTYDYDTNQVMEIAAALTLLMNDPDSAFFAAGSYRTKANTVVQDAVNLLLAFQISGGKVPVGDPIPPADGRPMYDTVYGGFTLTTAAVVYKQLGTGVHQDLPLFIGGGDDWYDTVTEGASVHYDSSAGVSYVEREFPSAGYLVMGRTNPLLNVHNTASFNTSTDRWGWYSAPGFGSVSSPSTIADGAQARSLQGAVLTAAALGDVATTSLAMIV
jgi:hypothetical protein